MPKFWNIGGRKDVEKPRAPLAEETVVTTETQVNTPRNEDRQKLTDASLSNSVTDALTDEENPSVDSSIWDATAQRIKPQFTAAIVDFAQSKDEQTVESIAEAITAKLAENNQALDKSASLTPPATSSSEIIKGLLEGNEVNLETDNWYGIARTVKDMLQLDDKEQAQKALNTFFVSYAQNLANANESDSILN